MPQIIKNILFIAASFIAIISMAFAMDNPSANLVIGEDTCLFESNGVYVKYSRLDSKSIFNEIIPLPKEVERELGISEITKIPVIEASTPQHDQAKDKEYPCEPIEGKEFAILFMHGEKDRAPYLKVEAPLPRGLPPLYKKKLASSSEEAMSLCEEPTPSTGLWASALSYFLGTPPSEAPKSLPKEPKSPEELKSPHDFLLIVDNMMHRKPLRKLEDNYVLLQWLLQSHDVVKYIMSLCIDGYRNDVSNLARFREALSTSPDCEKFYQAVQIGLCGEQSPGKGLHKGDKNGNYNMVIVNYTYSSEAPVVGKNFFKQVLIIRFSEKQIDELVNKVKPKF